MLQNEFIDKQNETGTTVRDLKKKIAFTNIIIRIRIRKTIKVSIPVTLESDYIFN